MQSAARAPMELDPSAAHERLLRVRAAEAEHAQGNDTSELPEQDAAPAAEAAPPPRVGFLASFFVSSETRRFVGGGA